VPVPHDAFMEISMPDNGIWGILLIIIFHRKDAKDAKKKIRFSDEGAVLLRPYPPSAGDYGGLSSDAGRHLKEKAPEIIEGFSLSKLR